MLPCKNLWIQSFSCTAIHDCSICVCICLCLLALRVCSGHQACPASKKAGDICQAPCTQTCPLGPDAGRIAGSIMCQVIWAVSCLCFLPFGVHMPTRALVYCDSLAFMMWVCFIFTFNSGSCNEGFYFLGLFFTHVSVSLAGAYSQARQNSQVWLRIQGWAVLARTALRLVHVQDRPHAPLLWLAPASLA